MIPFQITFLDFPESDAVWIAAQNRIEKLEHFFNRIIRCEVVISCPHRHRHADRLYNTQIHIFLPGNDVVVNRNPSQNEAHRDVYVSIRDAFNSAERILQKRTGRIRHEIKFHENQHGEGKISKIFFQDGFGFLVTNDGREIYFDRNSLINKSFDHLSIGQKVKFNEEIGEKGPQVTSMVAR